jgi:hypothetical protein
MHRGVRYLDRLVVPAGKLLRIEWEWRVDCSTCGFHGRQFAASLPTTCPSCGRAQASDRDAQP